MCFWWIFYCIYMLYLTYSFTFWIICKGLFVLNVNFIIIHHRKIIIALKKNKYTVNWQKLYWGQIIFFAKLFDHLNLLYFSIKFNCLFFCFAIFTHKIIRLITRHAQIKKEIQNQSSCRFHISVLLKIHSIPTEIKLQKSSFSCLKHTSKWTVNMPTRKNSLACWRHNYNHFLLTRRVFK